VAVLRSPFRSVSGHHVLLPTLDLIRCDIVLRLRERQLAGADFRIKLVLKLIPFGSRSVGLRPQVLHVFGATSFKWDQMVDFATVWSSSPATFHIDLVARGFGDMAMLAHPHIHRNGYTVSWSSSRLRERLECRGDSSQFC
jgi:hypothetical protein